MSRVSLIEGCSPERTPNAGTYGVSCRTIAPTLIPLTTHNDKEMFDNSDYPESSPFHFSDNKKVIGKTKDEATGVPITEFVGLRSKMYSYIKDGGGRTAKGVKKSAVKKVIRHENYREVIFNSRQLHHNMRAIRSANHQLHATTSTRSLSPAFTISDTCSKTALSHTLTDTTGSNSDKHTVKHTSLS